MEFTARTVTHPNAKLDRKTAMASLQKHPEFKRGTVVVGMKQDRQGRWVAQLHEPKVAADTPPMLDDMPSPMDEPMPDEGKEPKDLEAPDDEGDDDKGEKATLESLTEIVEQIAKAVGVSPKGDDAKEPMDDPLPPMDGPLDGPPGPPKPPGGAPKETIHRKAPMGVTPVGSPAFASKTKTASPKVASFDVEEPWSGTIKQAREAIEAQYGAHGYKVKKIARSTRGDGTPVIRARVSVR